MSILEIVLCISAVVLIVYSDRLFWFMSRHRANQSRAPLLPSRKRPD